MAFARRRFGTERNLYTEELLLREALTHRSLYRRKFTVKLPTIWADGKAEVGRVREEKPISEKSREEKE